jgi:hypothetical protein
MKEEMQYPTLKIVFVNEFGDKTVVKKSLEDSHLSSLVRAFSEALAGIGFHQESINEYIEEE